MSEREVVFAIVEWLRMHHEDIANALFDEVPEAAIILAGESKSAPKRTILGIEVKGT